MPTGFSSESLNQTARLHLGPAGSGAVIAAWFNGTSGASDNCARQYPLPLVVLVVDPAAVAEADTFTTENPATPCPVT